MKLDILQVQGGFFGREVGALQWVEQMKEQENTWLYHEVEDGVEISDGEAQKLATDHGKLFERGTHQELLEQRGIYAELYETQAEYYREESRNVAN